MRLHFKKQYSYSSRYGNAKIYYHNPYVYVSERSGYYVQFRTKNERSQNNLLNYDEDCRYYGIKSRRSDPELNPWDWMNEHTPCRDYRKSWKEFTHCKKQWMHNLK